MAANPEPSSAKQPTVLARRLTQSRTVAWWAWGLAMGVLAATVGGGTFHLRAHLREHLAQRDGEVLTAVALARQYANGSGSNLTQRLSNPADQLALVLEISQLREGVLGVRLFDGNGRFETALPPTLLDTPLEPTDLPALRSLQPVSRFHESASLGDYFLLAPQGGQARTPLLEVLVPLYPRNESRLVAAAQLLLDGRPVLQEYARVDKHLWPLGLGLFAAGAVLLSSVLLWAYRRLQKANFLVEERTARLLKANHELALAAKTNALGAVTAHLVHGLSNPLANLRDFVAARQNGAADEDLDAVSASTARMHQLVSDVVRVLGEEQGGEQYQLTLAELAGLLQQKLLPVAQEKRLELTLALEAQGNLSNRDANLVLLILENLAQNAVKVTLPKGRVRIRVFQEGEGIGFEVSDEGPGIQPALESRLFTPCRSTQGGSGLGLAISKQLANHLGAELRLKLNSPQGCIFELELPSGVVSPAGVAEPPGMPEPKAALEIA